VTYDITGAGGSSIYHHSIERFSYAGITAAATEAPPSSADKKSSLRALVVFNTGLTAVIQSLPPTSTSTSTAEDNKEVLGKELWRRDEALSRIKQAVILEDPRGTQLHAAVEGGDVVVIPTFEERLQMQLKEITVRCSPNKTKIDHFIFAAIIYLA
jgi:hypothetical protein